MSKWCSFTKEIQFINYSTRTLQFCLRLQLNAAAVQSGGGACNERFVNCAEISVAFTSLNINSNSQLSRGLESERKFL